MEFPNRPDYRRPTAAINQSAMCESASGIPTLCQPLFGIGVKPPPAVHVPGYVFVFFHCAVPWPPGNST